MTTVAVVTVVPLDWIFNIFTDWIWIFNYHIFAALTQECQQFQFECVSGECVNVLFVNDLKEDCADGSDEKNIGFESLGSGAFISAVTNNIITRISWFLVCLNFYTPFIVNKCFDALEGVNVNITCNFINSTHYIDLLFPREFFRFSSVVGFLTLDQWDSMPLKFPP